MRQCGLDTKDAHFRSSRVTRKQTKDKDALWVGVVTVQIRVQVVRIDGDSARDGVSSL